MKIQDIYNITLNAADTKASEQIQVGFCLLLAGAITFEKN
jgi:hypothetical protein